MTDGITLEPPYYVTLDVNTSKPTIWTESGNHLVATIELESEGQSSPAMQIARLFAAAPDLKAAILNSDDAHWTSAMRAAIAKTEG